MKKGSGGVEFQDVGHLLKVLYQLKTTPRKDSSPADEFRLGNLFTHSKPGCIPAFPDSTTEMFYILNHIHKPEVFPFKEPVKTIWNESIKAVTPTFKTGLDYVKIFWLRTCLNSLVRWKMQSEKRQNQHELRDNEIMKKFSTMNCSEEALCLSHHYKKTKDFHLKWFSYYKKNPNVFREHYNSSKLQFGQPRQNWL